jgi:hypothetical protein
LHSIDNGLDGQHEVWGSLHLVDESAATAQLGEKPLWVLDSLLSYVPVVERPMRKSKLISEFLA